MLLTHNAANHRLPQDAERSGAAFGSPSEFVLLAEQAYNSLIFIVLYQTNNAKLFCEFVSSAMYVLGKEELFF